MFRFFVFTGLNIVFLTPDPIASMSDAHSASQNWDNRLAAVAGQGGEVVEGTNQAQQMTHATAIQPISWRTTENGRFFFFGSGISSPPSLYRGCIFLKSGTPPSNHPKE